MDQVFSKETEMIYVLRKHTNQSDFPFGEALSFAIVLDAFDVDYG